MKYIKNLTIDTNQINLILDNNIKFDDIFISDLYLKINKRKEDYLVTYSNTVIKVKNFDFEDIILKINDPYLYIYYSQHVLKKPYENCKGIINDELIDAAISSIKERDKTLINYSITMKIIMSPKTEKRIINNLKDNLLNNGIGFAFEIGNSYLYKYIKMTKEKNLEFEKLLLDYSNQNGGLKITGIPYEEESDFLSYRTILDEAIYNYTITNRDGTWPEIGINNRQDLLKLRTQIVDHDTLQFNLSGYGELDY
jgi:hypothetical protein